MKPEGAMATPAGDDLRLARLPAWARREIKDLRGRLATANAKLAAGPEDSDTFADPYADMAGGVSRPLGKGTRVRYLLEPLDYEPGVQVWAEDGALIVMGQRRLLIRPVSSNMVEVRMERS